MFYYVQHGVMSANAKMALFFDWLLYNKDVDNIMNVGECYLNNVYECVYVSMYTY